MISAFNFPCAVYGWNNALALVTGNAVVWKPAPSTPLVAVAVTKWVIVLLQILVLSDSTPGSALLKIEICFIWHFLKHIRRS